MIIDFHAHTSNHKMKKLHTESASISALENEAQRHGISTIFLMATYFPLKGTGVHNTDLLERIENRPLFKMFGSLDVMNRLDTGLDELKCLAKKGKIAGIKLYPGYQGFAPDEQRTYGIYELAQKYGLPIMLHGGELHSCCFAAENPDSILPCGFKICQLGQYQEMSKPQRVIKPAQDFPEVKFVVSHLANPYFEQLRQVMRICPNVFTDISGQFVSGSPEDTEPYRQLVAAQINKFLLLPDGINRVIFATDFPIQSYKDSFELVRSLRLGKEREERIFALNALSVLAHR